MKRKRKQYSGAFKAKVGLQAVPAVSTPLSRTVRDAVNGQMLPTQNVPIFTANYAALTNKAPIHIG